MALVYRGFRMNQSTTFRLLLAFPAIGAFAVSGQAQSLKVGSPAPAIQVATWVKGKSVKSFEKGKLYVVEFWATWCGPCKESIPHLTEMAKKYKNVTFIGVDSYEHPADNLDGVKKFVADMGPKMDYNVAVDGSAAYMADNWMKAANQNGIPTAFVVDKNGTIAWIGHPMSMEPVLDKVVSGTFDTAAEAQRADDAANKQKEIEANRDKIMAHAKKFAELKEQGDYKGALAELNATIKETPATETMFGTTKFELMARLADPETNAYGKHLADDVVKDDPVGLNQVAWYLIDDDVNFKGADLSLAVSIAQRAVELSKSEDPSILDTYGYALFKTGKIDKAIEIEERAVKLSNTQSGVDDETKQDLADRLAKFKKAKGGGN